METESRRTFGLLAATGIGVGAIVGGGVLALAGVAFSAAGPAAIVAFALNGLVALLTALSFAEMSAAFPESGGTYAFAKKVLSVEAAFAVGWVVWFASIAAGVLYALGFAAYAATVIDRLWSGGDGAAPPWASGPWAQVVFAIGAVTFYALDLTRRSAGAGQWATIGKVVLFAVLIAVGLWVLAGRSLGAVRASLSPFAPNGASGLLRAMGYTFIALQGFDLVAAVAGEVRDPRRNVPRAMLFSLAIALAIYLPLLLVVATVGMRPGDSITEASIAQPETIVAVAAGNYLGTLGFWLVMVAAILSMLSALQANLFAASRVAMAMARDRTLPRWLGRLHATRGTPMAAVVTSAVPLALIILVVPDVAAAGAAASLIFLISFSLAHWTSILARRRTEQGAKGFPFVAVGGGSACAGLALFQGIEVPSAGAIAAVWLVVGGLLFVALLARRARAMDASAEAIDPTLARLRGRRPLVLVPIANPANAEAMVAVANALVAPRVGRVLLLSVVSMPKEWERGVPPPQLLEAQAVLRESLTASFAAGLTPEALTTVAPHPWEEIRRVAALHRCESLLLGLGDLTAPVVGTEIAELMSRVDSDVVVLRAPTGWQLAQARRVLVPIAGRGGHDVLRARLLGSLYRTGAREVTFLRVLPVAETDLALRDARRALALLAEDEIRGNPEVVVIRDDSAAAAIAEQAKSHDLVILGMQRLGRWHKTLGEVALRITRDTACAIIMISRRG